MLERSVIVNMPSARVVAALGQRTLPWEVRLEDCDGHRRTRLTARVPTADGGYLADAAEHLVAGELRRMKAVLETGEVATVAGQPEGERGLIGSSVARFADAARRALDELARRQLAGAAAGAGAGG
jgi:hypothetical protein